MASGGQPVSQNHSDPHSLTTDLSFSWDNFTFTDNKQMPGNDEVSAMERSQRAAGMNPMRNQNNNPRQAATTTATTPINNVAAYQPPPPPAGGFWPPLPDEQFASYPQHGYPLTQQQMLQRQAQFIPHAQFNQQPPDFQHQHNRPPSATYHQLPSQHLAQSSMSSVGYPSGPQHANPAMVDQQFYQGNPRTSNTPSGPELARRPPKPLKHGRKASRGPLTDKTNRVLKPQKSPGSAHSQFLKITSMPGDINRKFYTLMGDRGAFVDEQDPALPWQDLVEFVMATQNHIKSEPMSRENSGIEHAGRGVSYMQDEYGNTGMAPDVPQNDRKYVARSYRGYQKEFRPKESSIEYKYKCTLGCPWSHKTKSNWERHERTHYPQEIWVCCHEDCLDKSAKTRVSFRKDLARRHHADHHQQDGDSDLTDKQLDELKIRVADSMFPRQCVFQGCPKTFTTFDERSVHMESHLKNSDVLDKSMIVKYYNNEGVQPDHDNDAEHDLDNARPGYHGLDPDTTRNYDDEDDGEDEDEDDDDEGGAGGMNIKHHHNDRDDGTGAGGTGSNQWTTYGGAAGSTYQTNTNYQQQGYSPMSTTQNYSLAYNFDTFGHIPAIDKRPWKMATSLRLQLLPQMYARAIGQTPIVLKKIQLQAAMMLELSSVKKPQIVNILQREIAMMAGALPASSGPSIKRFPQLTALTKLLPVLTKTVSKFDKSCIAKQNQAILKFAGFRKDLLSQELEDPGGGDNSGHIYLCLPIRSTMAPIRPSRLVHVGTKNKPILRLDTSEGLPSHVDYCSLSHCWDNGYGLCLSKGNVTSLKQSIPADGLTQTFQIAVNIARERGLEYLWIDTLCIIQDSAEDIQAEVPRITQIHASAAFAIVITSVAYDRDAQPCDESTLDDKIDFDEKSEEYSRLETSELTPGDTVETELPESSEAARKDDFPVATAHQSSERRGSHQLESFLAEGSKRSFFSPLLIWDKISLTQSTPPTSSHSNLDSEKQVDNLDRIPSTKPASRITHYLDRWRFRWHKLSTQPQLASTASITTTSPAPSVSDQSTRSEKKRHSISVLPVSFEKLFRGFRSRPTYETNTQMYN